MQRALVPALVGILLLPALPAGADDPPPPLPDASRYLVPDAADPHVLRPAPGFDGFDAGYVQLMSRPHVTPPAASLQKPPVRLSAPDDLPAPNPFLDVEDHVFVIQGTQDLYDPNTGEFDAAGNGLFTVAQDVLQNLGDNFDFIAIFSTANSQSSNFAAFYLPLKNHVKGLGACNPQTGETFGCDFDQLQGSGIQNLQGLLFMNSPAFWQDWDRQVDGTVHPFDDFDSNVFAVLGQETAHRWGAALRFLDKNGNKSKKLLGRDLSHWAAYVDTDASVMDGWDWQEPQNGRFKLLNDMDVFSTLDLYAMGALPVASAKPFFFIDGATYDVKGANAGFLSQLEGRAIGAADVLELGLPSVQLMKDNGIDLGAKGTKVELTIQDIVNAEGNRCPDADHTQRALRQALVLVTRPGQTPAQAQGDIDSLNTIAKTWEKWWTERTGHALTLCTSLDGVCRQALMSLGGGVVDSKGGKGFIERGETVTLHMTAAALAKYSDSLTTTADGDTVKNAHLVISLDGSGAEHTTLDSADVSVGDIKPGATVDVPVKLTVDDQYPCGSSLIVTGQLEADNAPTVSTNYRLFPGYQTTFLEPFTQSGDKFKVNEDGRDGAKKGALAREEVQLSCDMTPRTPESDNTPGGKGAYVTKGELQGDTSLWSSPMDLSGTSDPELAFDFWLEGEASDTGDSLLIELSKDGKDFVKADQVSDSEHGWGLKRIPIRDVFKGELPQQVTARFIFNGGGHLEGGIDNVRILDPQGQCRVIVAGICGCTTDGGAGPQAAIALVLGLLGLRVLRRRR